PAPRDLPATRAGDGIDGARLSRARERPGRDGRLRAGRARDPRAAARRAEGGRTSDHAARVERTRDLRLHAFLLGSRAAPLALAGLSLVLILVTWNTWGDPAADTGYDTLAGIRVAHGQLPYVAFTYYYGPLAPLGLGLASLLGGGRARPSSGRGLAVALGIVFATYALAASLAGPRGGFLAGALVAVVAVWPAE